jgi:hypothetical protein
MSGEDKQKILFLHGIKTGGTSLRYMLFKEYGYARTAPVPVLDFEAKQAYPIVAGRAPLQYGWELKAEDVAGYDLVMGHYDWEVADKLPERAVVCMLRHPVRQLVSVYTFMLSSPDFPDFNPPPFMEWVQTPDGQKFLNGQVKTFSSHRKPNLEVALKNLEDNRLALGIMEFFDLSVRRWNDHFGWSMQVEHRNKSSRQVELSEDEARFVGELQAEDMQLVQKGLELFFPSGWPKLEVRDTTPSANSSLALPKHREGSG